MALALRSAPLQMEVDSVRAINQIIIFRKNDDDMGPQDYKVRLVNQLCIPSLMMMNGPRIHN